MANTYTLYYNLTKPEVGADTNLWGTHLNSDLDSIDGQLYKCVDKTLTSSQTMSGALALPSNGLNVGSGQLNVTGGNVAMSGNLSVTGTQAFTGNATFGGTMAVTGNTIVGGTFAVTGATTLASNGLNVGSGQLNVTGGNVSTSGNLSIGGTLSVTGLASLASNGLNVGSGQLVVTGGNVTASGSITASGNVTAYSDERLKSDIRTIEYALDKVKALRGVYFNMRATGMQGVGVVAQEVNQVFPEVIHHNSDGLLSVAYGNLVGVLIEAVKELSARVEELEAR